MVHFTIMKLYLFSCFLSRKRYDVYLIIQWSFFENQAVIFTPLTLLMQKVRQVKQLPVNLKSLMDGLSSLLLPSQKPVFSQRMYAL